MSAKTSLWLAGAAMLLCAVAANTLRPTSVSDPGFQLEQLIPTAFGDWKLDTSVVPIAPSPDVQASLDKIYDQILSRTYVNPRGERVMLVVAYGGEQSDSLKAHRQEVCYAAQGFSIAGMRDDSVHFDGADVPIVRMHAVRGRRSEPVSYWFTMGDKVAMGRAERLVTQVSYGLQGRIPDGLLMRVSNVSGDVAASYDTHDEFLRALMHAVDPKTRQRLAGRSAGTS